MFFFKTWWQGESEWKIDPLEKEIPIGNHLLQWPAMLVAGRFFSTPWGNDPFWLIFFRWVETKKLKLHHHFIGILGEQNIREIWGVKEIMSSMSFIQVVKLLFIWWCFIYLVYSWWIILSWIHFYTKKHISQVIQSDLFIPGSLEVMAIALEKVM